MTTGTNYSTNSNVEMAGFESGGVRESCVYSKRSKKSTSAGFVL